MLGLTLTPDSIRLRPFKTLRFSLKKFELAGCVLTVVVEPNWSRAIVDGAPVDVPVALSRGVTVHEVRFVA
jgi:hypothetical protein